MKRLAHVMDIFLRKVGLPGIVPTGNIPPDNTESFDEGRQPEQYAEFIDAVS